MTTGDSKRSGIVMGMKGKPAYNLVFGVILASGGVGTGSSIFGLTIEDESTKALYIIAGIISFMIACGTALIAIKIVEQNPHNNVDNYPGSEKLRKEYCDFLSALMVNLKSCESVKTRIFHTYVGEECDKFLNTVAEWGTHTFTVPGSTDGVRVLGSVYRNATEKIFATSVAMPGDDNFSQIWFTEEGDNLSKIHLKGGASVIRVFVFDYKKDVSKKLYDSIEKQAAIERVEIRMYFDKEDKVWHFDPDISRDFTIVDDGMAIGVTLLYNKNDNDLRARWYFESEDRAPHFRNMRDKLLQNSMTFEQFQNWWKDWCKKEKNCQSKV